MPITDRQVLWIAAACYAFGLLYGTLCLIRARRHSRVAMYTVIVVGYVLQSIGLLMRGLAVKSCPIGNSFEILQFCGWAATTIYLFIGATFRLSMLGYFTAGLSAILATISLSFGSWDATHSKMLSDSNPWVPMHAGLAMFGYGTFSLLALTSLLHLIRHYSLRSKRLSGWFSFLPSLIELDQIGTRLLGFGLALFTVAMGVGYLYWRIDKGTVDHLKVIAVFLVWAGYSAIFVARLKGRLVGHYFAIACVVLYLGALVSLDPVNRSRYPDRTQVEQAHHE